MPMPKKPKIDLIDGKFYTSMNHEELFKLDNFVLNLVDLKGDGLLGYLEYEDKFIPVYRLDN